MFDRLKIPFFVSLFLLLFGWMGWGIVSYFTHTTPPSFTLKGVDHNGSYARTIECAIIAKTSYKISHVTATIDGKQLLTQRVKARQCNVPFIIDTTMLEDGDHTLAIEVTDTSYNANTTTKSYVFHVDNKPLLAAFIDEHYKGYQGKTLHMKIRSNKKLAIATMKLFSSTYSFYPENEDSTSYECFVPIDCEERPQEYTLTAEVQDAVGNTLKLSNTVYVKPFEFKKQRGFSVDTEKISQEREISMDAKILREAMGKWINESPKKKLWSGAFEYPMEVSRITTPFGEIRTTPERGRYMHKGIDLIHRPKCVVWASQHGKVIIKDRYLLTGNTVVLDHGVGVFTLYAHLEDFADITVGDMLKKGSPLGRVGKTGYASGYHLHWELLINNISVDPIEWITTTF